MGPEGAQHLLQDSLVVFFLNVIVSFIIILKSKVPKIFAEYCMQVKYCQKSHKKCISNGTLLHILYCTVLSCVFYIKC